jgi:hypothetical protein
MQHSNQRTSRLAFTYKLSAGDQSVAQSVVRFQSHVNNLERAKIIHSHILTSIQIYLNVLTSREDDGL